MGKIPKQKSNNNFFHSLNDFDAPEIEESVVEEYIPPPPPVFSEQEVDSFKRQAFEEGKAEGHRLALSSIEQKSSFTLSQIEDHLSLLLQRETERNSVFERESVHFTRAVFEKLFPVYKERFGFDEFVAVLKEILEKRPRDSAITIALSKVVLDAVKNHFPQEFHDHIHFTVGENIGESECRLQWSQGGAYINMDQLCEQIRISLDQSLEDMGVNSHDVMIEKIQEISDE